MGTALNGQGTSLFDTPASGVMSIVSGDANINVSPTTGAVVVTLNPDLNIDNLTATDTVYAETVDTAVLNYH